MKAEPTGLAEGLDVVVRNRRIKKELWVFGLSVNGSTSSWDGEIRV